MADTAITTNSNTNPKSSRSGMKFLFYLLLLCAIAFGVVSLIFSYTYSEGNRAGVVVKFSKKGYIFKTYEGELNMGGMNTITNTAQANQIWTFSVTDSKVADSMMKLEGKRVSLHYKEKLKTLPWKGETKYFVYGLEVLP